MEFPEHLYQIGRGTRSKPVAVYLPLVEGLQEAEGIEYIGRRPREMIAIVLTLEHVERLLPRPAVGISQHLQIILHPAHDLLFRNTAYPTELLIHTDVGQVIQLTEDTELRELRDARQEDKLQIGVTILQGGIEVAHHIPKYGKHLPLMHHIQQRGVILIDQDHHLPARLTVQVEDQVLQTDIRIRKVR